MKTELLTFCDHLVAAALNGAYQGLLVTVFVALALRLLRRTNAATRHAIWLATLILVVCLLPAHYWRHALASDKAPAKETPLAADWGPQTQERVKAHETEPDVSPKDETFLPEAPTRDPDVLERSDSAPPKAPVSQVITPVGAPQILPLSRVLLLESKLPRITCLCLMCLWFITAGTKTVLLVWRLYRVRKLKAQSLPATQELDDLFQSLRKKLTVSRPVRLGISPVHSSPMVVGFLHPEVLLPATETETIDPAETEHILRHELAHVQRRDDWANLLQHFTQAFMFFHPAVWWISKQLSLEREIACDDFVLEQVGKPRAYALTLASLAGRVNRRSSVLAPGISTSKSQLQQRINMILDTQRNTSPRLARTRVGILTSASAIIAVLALNSAPRLVLAQDQRPDEHPSPPVAIAPGISKPTSRGNNVPAPIALELVAHGGALVSASAPAGPGELLEPGAATQPDIGSGPKYKPDNENDASDSEPETVAPPRPPRRPVRPSGGDAHGRKSDSSIEERLDRLERMVQSLMTRQNSMSPDELRKPDVALQVPVNPQWTIDFQNRTVEFQNKMQDFAREQAARDIEQSKRAAKQAERAVQELNRDRKSQQEQKDTLLNDGKQEQLKELLRAREELARELKKLDGAINKIQRDKELLKQMQPQKRAPEPNANPNEN